MPRTWSWSPRARYVTGALGYAYGNGSEARDNLYGISFVVLSLATLVPFALRARGRGGASG